MATVASALAKMVAALMDASGTARFTITSTPTTSAVALTVSSPSTLRCLGGAGGGGGNNHQTGDCTGIVHFLIILLGLAKYFVVVIVLELQELEHKVHVIIDRIEVIALKDLLDLFKNILYRFTILLHIVIDLNKHAVEDIHAALIYVKAV